MLDGLGACNQGKHADLKNCTSYEHVNWPIQKWVFAILQNSIISSHEVVWWVLGHFGKLGMCTTIHIWSANWNSNWKCMENDLEVG